MAQLVRRPTFDFSSGRDLTVCGVKSHVGLCTDREFSLSLSLSPSAPSPVHALSLALEINIFLKKINSFIHFT